MRDKPEVSTGAACLSPGGLPRSLSALAPVDACIRPRAARPRMRPSRAGMLPMFMCFDTTARGFGSTMEEAYAEWRAKQAEYYWSVLP